MQEIIQLYKKIGETPLQALNRLRYEELRLANQKMTFLGRLDPMAEGLMLALVGDTQDKERYLALEKEYEFEVLWEFETDTYDLLGLLVSRGEGANSLESSRDEEIETFARSFTTRRLGRQRQQYPPFSSKRVAGKQLFQWAREGVDVERPEREINIYSFKFLGSRRVEAQDLLKSIVERVSKVRGDFRQEEIFQGWQEELGREKGREFIISKFKAHVSSGTYIRGLVEEMGQESGWGALAYGIKRTKVGEYHL